VSPPFGGFTPYGEISSVQSSDRSYAVILLLSITRSASLFPSLAKLSLLAQCSSGFAATAFRYAYKSLSIRLPSFVAEDVSCLVCDLAVGQAEKISIPIEIRATTPATA
jgi:hypothetical protein